MREELARHPGLEAVHQAVADRFRGAIGAASFAHRELSITINKDHLHRILSFLKSDLGFAVLDDIIGLDNLKSSSDGGKRFAVLYQICRRPDGLRLRLRIDLGADESVASITPIYRSADWGEREIYDMLGIRFDGHPDLRRIYLPEDFDGHPLRKDFPLAGEKDGV